MAALNETWIVQPHQPLEQVADGIWSVEGSIQMPLGRFPRRMTVIVLADGGLAVWSAIPLDDAEMQRFDALGPVRFLIVPNAGHRLDVKAWKLRYPGAKVVAPPKAAKDVAEAVPVDATENILGDPTVTVKRLQGTKADEFALIVARADGTTLILNDILSSIRKPRGLGAKIMVRVFGFGVRHPRTSRLVRQRYVANPETVARQFDIWAGLPNLKRIIVSHVDIIDETPSRALAGAAKALRG